MRLLVFMLLVSSQVFAQTKKPELDIKDVYKTSLREYVKAHPDDVTKTAAGQVIFVKNQPFSNNLEDTIGSVVVKFIDLESEKDTLLRYLPKKQKFIVLDEQQLISRGGISYVWISPMKVSWKPKNRELSEPLYKDLLCSYGFESRTEEKRMYYFFTEGVCKDIK